MKRISLVFLILAGSMAGWSQGSGDSITMEQNFWGVKFYQGFKLLKPKEVLRVMEPNQEAYALFKKAKSQYDASNIIGGIGGFMVGWPIGTAIAGGEPEWGLAAGGAALILASIPLSASFAKNASKAIKLYNNPSSANRYAPKLYYGIHATGMRVVIKF